jgi:hypothetical protein
MASDWKFAAHEGYLTWTTPALPSGGQRLFTKLTPTLLVGQLQADDAVPTDYLDIPSIVNLTLRSSTAIHAERNNGDSHLFVADTADEARAWFDSMQRARQNSRQYSASHAVQTSPVTPASGPWGADGAATANDSSAVYSSLSTQLRQEREQLNRQREANEAARAELSRDQAHQLQRERDLRVEEARLQQLQAEQRNQRQSAPTAFSSTSAASAQRGASTGFASQYDASPQPRGANDFSDGLPPRGPAQPGPSRPVVEEYNPYGAGSGGLVYGSDSAGPSVSRPMASPSVGMHHPSPRPLPPDGCPTDPSGTHQFRPLALGLDGGNADYSSYSSAAGGGANLGLRFSSGRPLADQAYYAADNAGVVTRSIDGGFAQTTSVATHEERPVPGLKAPHPLQGLPSTPSLRLAASASGLSDGPSLSGVYAANRPLDPSGQLRYASASGGAAPPSFGPGDGGDLAFRRALHAAGVNRTPDVAGYPARNLSQGPRPNGRSGMMVDLPGTQAVNRNIAPNASAVWREWMDPDGTTYFFHEPTKTLQRLAPGATEYETLVQGADDVPAEDLAQRSHRDEDTTINLNTQTVRNLRHYGDGNSGRGGVDSVRSPNALRSEILPPQPRGSYSPTRRTPLEALTAPRMQASTYQGKRLHRLTLQPGDEPGQAVVSHQVQSLDSDNMVWDPRSGTIGSRDPAKIGVAGSAALHRQWEHVRKTLCQGRYFKKHAVTTDTHNFRFVFLTGDNAYICCVPTSEVMINVSKDPKTFGTAADTIQYYGAETRAMAVNSISHVVLGIEEPRVARRRALNPENTVVIVSRTHALILECNTREEAQFFCDAWNFFLEYSRPVNPKATRTPQMVAPVTYGTRTGLAF